MNTESQTDQDRIAQLEASCATKDKVINDVRFFLQDYLKSVTHPGVSRLVGDCYAATDTDAGKSLLDRLNAAENQCVLFKTEAQNVTAINDQLGDRLQAVEAERDRYKAELDKLAEVASDCVDFDYENQVPVCHCCGMELDMDGKGHKCRPPCLANLILEALQPAQKDAPQKGTK